MDAKTNQLQEHNGFNIDPQIVKSIRLTWIPANYTVVILCFRMSCPLLIASKLKIYRQSSDMCFPPLFSIYLINKHSLGSWIEEFTLHLFTNYVHRSAKSEISLLIDFFGTKTNIEKLSKLTLSFSYFKLFLFGLCGILFLLFRDIMEKINVHKQKMPYS